MVTTTARNRRQNHGTTAMTPDRKRRDLFLALIDALLEHVQMNTRMDIRDRIAALALVDRVLAREKSDVDAERAGSKVRDTARPSRRPIRLGERQIPDREGGPSAMTSAMTSAATTTEKVTIALLNVPHSICDRLRSNLRRFARELATGIRSDYAATLPSAVSCFDDDFEACIAHLRLPVTHRRTTRTTNLLERLFVEERRRLKIIPNGFGEKPILKLMFGALIRALLLSPRVAASSISAQ
jgi:hypothetical protein